MAASGRVRVAFGAPAEHYVERVLRPFQRPGITQLQPLIGRLHLPSIFDLLIEDAILVPNPVTDRRNVQRGQRVHEARSQPPQPTVTKARLLLLLDQHTQVEAQRPHRLLSLVVDAEVDEVVGKMRPGEELRGEVADHAHILRLVVLHCGDPAFNQTVTYGMRQRHIQIVDGSPLTIAALYTEEIVQKGLSQCAHSQRCSPALVHFNG